MSKAFLHLGAHKTATTFLQANFTDSRRDFEKQGWKFVCFQRKAPQLRELVRRARKGAEMPEADRARLDGFFADLRADRDNIFFSSEIFLGPMSPGRKGEIYPNHAAAIAKLKERFAGRDVTAGFCIRDFADYLESGYRWLVAHGGSHNFKSYSQNATVKTLTWLPIIESLAEAFGTNIVIWTFEDFAQNPVGALKAIAKTAGIDPDRLGALKQEPRNASMPADIVTLLSSWNKMLREHKGFSTELRDALNGRFRALIAEIPSAAEPSSLLNPARRARLQAHYHRELEQIRARWGQHMLSFPPAPQAAAGIPAEATR